MDARRVALGQTVSRTAQARMVREVAASAEPKACCPVCQCAATITPQKRTVKGLDEPIELLEPKAYCSVCRRKHASQTTQTSQLQ